MRDFEAMLPPGWLVFDLTSPVKGAVSEAVDSMLADVPERARPSVRSQLEQPLVRSFTQLAAGGAVAAYLPVENPATASVFPVVAVRPASFVVDQKPVDPLEYMVALIAAGEAEMAEPVGMVGIKRVVDRDTSGAFRQKLAGVPADLIGMVGDDGRTQIDEARRLTRQVEYTIGVPETDDCWMVVSADISAVGAEGAEEVIDAVTGFLDAWVGTIRWREAATDE